MRKVEFIMGMPITVDIPECNNGLVFKKVFTRFRQIDQRFSPFKKSSELSKYQKGEIAKSKLSAEFKKILQFCKEAENMTGGFFSANFSGQYDPTGYVKGWAIEQGAIAIEKNGFKTYCIGAGGDILARSNGAKVWNIGIQDPTDKSKLIGKVSEKNIAVATSGNYERGAHIINPKTGKPANTFLSVTIIGPDIITADILATAIYAAEQKNAINFPKDYKAITIPQAP